MWKTLSGTSSFLHFKIFPIKLQHWWWWSHLELCCNNSSLEFGRIYLYLCRNPMSDSFPGGGSHHCELKKRLSKKFSLNQQWCSLWWWFLMKGSWFKSPGGKVRFFSTDIGANKDRTWHVKVLFYQKFLGFLWFTVTWEGACWFRGWQGGGEWEDQCSSTQLASLKMKIYFTYSNLQLVQLVGCRSANRDNCQLVPVKLSTLVTAQVHSWKMASIGRLYVPYNSPKI